MTEPSLQTKITIIKNVVCGKIFKPYYSDYYQEDAPSLVYSFYAATNENLHYMQDYAYFKSKDVLVPTASGDHALNAVFLGAKSVETFDINSIAKFNHNLKETAAKVLSRSEFIHFFTKTGFYNQQTYYKIQPYLQPETKEFFDVAYFYLNQTHRSFIMLTAEDAPTRRQFISANPYLKDEQSFAILKNNLLCLPKPIEHKLCPAHELKLGLNKKDIVLLSNIPTVYHSAGFDVKPMLKNIVSKTKLCMHYVFGELNAVQKYFLCRKFKAECSVKINKIASLNEIGTDLVFVSKTKEKS